MIEGYYNRWGYTRASTEGRFQFRHRAEVCTGLPIVDGNSLRERLYNEWCRRVGVRRPARPAIEDRDPTTEMLMDRVMAMWQR